MSARLVRRPEMLAFYLLTAYQPAFVTELKRLVPSQSRKWDEEAGHWILADTYEAKVVELCTVHFGGCQVVDVDGVLQ